MHTCKICIKEFKSARKLSCHLRFTHQLTSQQYYDSYLKETNEGTCCNCNLPTKFRNIIRGYYTYCSDNCRQFSAIRIAKIISTKNKKYGNKWPEIYKKQQKTVTSWSDERKKEYSQNLSNGLLNAHANDPTLALRKLNARKTKYSTKEWSDLCRNGHLIRTHDQIKEANRKRKETERIKYGVESHTQTDEYRVLVKSNNEKRTLEEKQEIIDRTLTTKVNKGYYLPFDHPDRKSKKEYKNKVRKMSEFWANLKFPKEELTRRGLNGVFGAIQLDHIVSLETCYQQKIPVEIAGHCANLRLISWQDNIGKYSNDHMTIQELIEAVNNYDETKHLK